MRFSLLEAVLMGLLVLFAHLQANLAWPDCHRKKGYRQGYASGQSY